MKIQDHKGNYFNSTRDMAEFWGVKPDTFHYRKGKGLPLEDCLSPRKLGVAYKGLTFKGVPYQSYSKLAEAYGLDKTTLHARLKSGMSLDKALSIPVRSKIHRTRGQGFTDHLGNTFVSLRDMCKC